MASRAGGEAEPHTGVDLEVSNEGDAVAQLSALGGHGEAEEALGGEGKGAAGAGTGAGLASPTTSRSNPRVFKRSSRDPGAQEVMLSDTVRAKLEKLLRVRRASGGDLGPEAPLFVSRLMSFAEFEREMIAERTKDKVAAARRKGKWTGGPVPLGYEVKDKRLVVDELEASVVREAFELYLQHGSMEKVARLLNERKLLPKAQRARNGCEVPRWTKDAVGRLLRNPVYAGLLQSGEELFEGEQQALVERAAWERVQRMLEGHERVPGVRSLNPAYVLRGVLRCGMCGAAMTPASSRRGKREYRYYRCTKRDKGGKEACPAKPMPAPVIEEYVVGRLVEATADGALVEGARSALESHLAERRERLMTRRAKLPGKIAKASANVARYVEELTKVQGRAREVVAQRLEQESERLAVLEETMAEAERTLDALEAQRVEGEWVAQALGDFSRVWSALTPANQGRLLRALVERVVVDERSGRVEVHLVNFAADTEADAAMSEEEPEFEFCTFEQ